jgi:membrane-associated protease RseP (regulator of RpoE activity)
MVKKKKKTLNNKLVTPTIVAILFLLISIIELFNAGQTGFFWLTFTIGGIIMLPNLIWLKTNKARIFGLPYILTMLKTKKFINTIIYLSKHAKILEKISIIGLFLGFGLAGIDYWVARKQDKMKRYGILILGAIILGVVYYFGLAWMFNVPVLEPLLILGLISFVLLGLGGLSMAFLIGYGALSLIALFTSQQICPSVAPVIPGVPIPGLGVVVPFIAWISLGAILIIHEFSHGILLAKYKEKIKSVGLILAGIFPVGAFVEQDDKTFNKINDKKQLLVLSAGPSSNLFTMFIGIILLFAFIFVTAPVSDVVNNEFEKSYDGIRVREVSETIAFCGEEVVAPALGVLEENDEILIVNGVDINNLSTLIITLNDNNDHNFVVLRNGEEETLNITPHKFQGIGVSRIGVIFEPIPSGYEVPAEISIISSLMTSINTIILFFIILSFAVGMFNFLPSDPLDGGRMAKIMLTPYVGFMGFKKVEEKQKFIGRIFAWLFVISILLNLLPYVTMFLF